MILKSLSRKTRSFFQLITYMDDEKADTHSELHRHCFTRGHDRLAGEFFENSKFLKSRKDGNYLYHEILSIDLKESVARSHAKQCLREIALAYVENRCPRNMVYGTLHDDHKDHIHYHLLISANERESRKRFRLTTKEFDTIKRELETHVLESYPELKQAPIVTVSKEEKKLSRKASDQKRRTGRLERKEAVASTILEAISQATTFEEFKKILSAQKFEYYTRGKNYGVEVTHDDGKIIKYRFAGLDVHETFEEFLAVVETLTQAQVDSENQADGSEEPPAQESPNSVPQSPESIVPEQSEFLQEMEQKRRKRMTKKARKGKPRSR